MHPKSHRELIPLQTSLASDEFKEMMRRMDRVLLRLKEGSMRSQIPNINFQELFQRERPSFSNEPLKASFQLQQPKPNSRRYNSVIRERNVLGQVNDTLAYLPSNFRRTKENEEPEILKYDRSPQSNIGDPLSNFSSYETAANRKNLLENIKLSDPKIEKKSSKATIRTVKKNRGDSSDNSLDDVKSPLKHDNTFDKEDSIFVDQAEKNRRRNNISHIFPLQANVLPQRDSSGKRERLVVGFDNPFSKIGSRSRKSSKKSIKKLVKQSPYAAPARSVHRKSVKRPSSYLIRSSLKSSVTPVSRKKKDEDLEGTAFFITTPKKNLLSSKLNHFYVNKLRDKMTREREIIKNSLNIK